MSRNSVLANLLYLELCQRKCQKIAPGPHAQLFSSKNADCTFKGPAPRVPLPLKLPRLWTPCVSDPQVSIILRAPAGLHDVSRSPHEHICRTQRRTMSTATFPTSLSRASGGGLIVQELADTCLAQVALSQLPDPGPQPPACPTHTPSRSSWPLASPGHWAPSRCSTSPHHMSVWPPRVGVMLRGKPSLVRLMVCGGNRE